MADRYEIKGRLGRGGVGAVYQAFDSHLGRDVAIKRLLPVEDTRLNDSAEESLQSEAKALASLSHPNIVTIFEFGEDEQGPFVVFELIEGDTLKDVISAGALSGSDFYAVADQMLDALVAAQKMNLLHRDIKPANIMLSWLPSGKFQIKILDFGLSKFAQEPSTQTLDQKGSFLGSIDYIAPEQIELLPLDQRTDLYSLGCVLYFSLTQRPPFTGGSMAETMNNHLAGKATPLEELRPDIPVAVSRWVMSLISMHPSERPDDALAALESLAAAKAVEKAPVADSSSAAKLVVPVVEVAQPGSRPKKLEDTQQIVSAPAPIKPVIPAHSSSAAGKRYIPKSNRRESVNPKILLGLTGSFMALVIVGGLIWAEDRRDRKNAAKLAQVPPLRSVVIPDLKKSVAPVSPGPTERKYIFENSEYASPAPPLPASDNLVAYYTVAGNILNTDRMRLNLSSPTENLGAIENAVPGAHKFHLVSRPEEDEKAPTIVDNWSGEKTIQFLPTQRLICLQRAVRDKPIVSEQFTFALLVKVAEKSTGSLLRPSVEDTDGKLHNRAVRLSYFNETVQVQTEFGGSLKMPLPSKQYRAVLIEIDTKAKTVNVWQRGKGGNPKIPDGGAISFPVSGPLSLKGYEFGHLTLPKSPEARRRVEIPVFSIYTTLLSEPEKQELADQFFASMKIRA
ncbi:MAG: serine/threonine-protein kinase [Verrucomicrobiales bacterium]|nr:serine/threonine-protein kinase [Verrucomicrobiales bacterium]